MPAIPIVSAAAARTLLLQGQGLLNDPSGASSAARVAKTVKSIGFVQVDSIQRVERAHHLILGARLDSYRASHLNKAAFEKRALFEHWTHDAAFIPVEWFHYWKPRFSSTEHRLRNSRWFSHRLGANPEETIARVYARIEKEGPLRGGDFERSVARPSTGWWDWTPEKAALEFLWHTGRLAIRGRDGFQKVYDLTERVFPEAHRRDVPHTAAHIDWMCSSALSRLGVATPSELAAFWDAISITEASQWCALQLEQDRIAQVWVESADGAKPRRAYATPDWQRRVRQADAPPDRIRLLAPFDPLVRDRKRALRLFNFDYRFEAFVPAKKRVFGYYVLPILDADRLIGRLEPRHDRDRQTLVIERVWWERGVKRTRDLKFKLASGLEILATQIGATQIEWSKS